MNSKKYPLCVDLDGTLIKTDTLFEACLILFKQNFFILFNLVFWVFHGKSYLKGKVFSRVILPIETFPVSKTFLKFLESEHQKGREIVLVTASHRLIAEKIKTRFSFFSDIIATQCKINLKGQNKRLVLNERFGAGNYDYAGNSEADLAIWQDARHCVVVNASRNLIQKVKRLNKPVTIFEPKQFKLKTFFKALRVHQYAKNLLVFVPLLASHSYTNLPSVKNSVLAFTAFCFLASTVYIINDLLDLKADRLNKTKSKRPFASGALSICFGVVLLPILIVLALLITFYLPMQFGLVLLIYFIITFLYSMFLKQKVLVDVFTLAILYTIRIIAGIAAIHTNYSVWLMAFSIFIFLSLAFVKRYTELFFAKQNNKKSLLNRGYVADDLPFISQFGIASGYLSILVFALYINSKSVEILYKSPHFLWVSCIILLFWVSRIWLLATRGKVLEDPVLFAIKDKTSFATLFLIMVVVIMAIMF